MRRLLFSVAAAGLVFLAAAAGLFAYACTRPPLGAELEGFAESWRIYDSSGRLIREAVGAGGARARWTVLGDISPLVIEATIAVEDERFHGHPGVDPIAVGRALFQNAGSGRVVSGASTLTMQLARIVRPHPKRTVRGKLDEAVDAVLIERRFGKRTILEQYLNRAPYGGGAIGVEAASHRYFGKPSLHLSLAEAALIAGLPKAPGELNPLKNPAGARARQRTVLRRMLEAGVIDRADHDRALGEPLAFRKLDARDPSAPSAMHYTDWMLSLGGAPGDVHTGLDGDLQMDVERIVRDHVAALAQSGATDASVVVLDNSTCEVIAMVGSADYWDEPSGAVNGTLAKRQPGSTLKPFTYALAFEKGWTPASVVADVETHYTGAGGALFTPRNYAGTFSGPVLMGEALARSLNVPAVRVAKLVGAETLLERLRASGFSSLDRGAAHYGLGLTLGNGEVTLLELARGYAMFARKGVECAGERVFSETVAFLITDILSDERLRIAAFGPSNALMVGFPAAAKTGTSSNWRDSWAVGYTDRYTVAVWTGDFSGRAMNQIAGVSGAGPLFHQVMVRTVRGAAGSGVLPLPPRPPESVGPVVVCAVSGRLATDRCPKRRMVNVPSEHAPHEDCPWHKEIAIDRRHDLRASPRCPKAFVEHRVFEVLPPEYAAWQAEHGTAVPPARWSPDCPADGPIAGEVIITSPRPDEVFLIEPGYDRDTQTVELRAEVDPPVAQVIWLVDGARVDHASWPYTGAWRLEPGRHRLIAVAGGKKSEPMDFEVR